MKMFAAQFGLEAVWARSSLGTRLTTMCWVSGPQSAIQVWYVGSATTSAGDRCTTTAAASSLSPLPATRRRLLVARSHLLDFGNRRRPQGSHERPSIMLCVGWHRPTDSSLHCPNVLLGQNSRCDGAATQAMSTPPAWQRFRVGCSSSAGRYASDGTSTTSASGPGAPGPNTWGSKMRPTQSVTLQDNEEAMI